MSHKHQIKLSIFNQKRALIVFPACLFVIAIQAMLMNQLILALVLLLMALKFEWIKSILRFSKLSPIKHVNGDELILIIFSDGRVRLISKVAETIEGFLGNRHWCTRHAAVIEIVSDRKTHRLVALSGEQEEPEDFRRLNMWLRQNIYPGARGELVLGSWPAMRDKKDVSRC